MKGKQNFYLTTPTTRTTVCRETIRSPSKRFIKNPAWLAELAQFYVDLNLSGDDTVDWILEQIYHGHDGELIDYNGHLIDKDKWFVEDEFGGEARRWVNAFKQRASSPQSNRLHEKCVNRVMAMYFARDIHLARSA